jgi:hypothetical protein
VTDCLHVMHAATHREFERWGRKKKRKRVSESEGVERVERLFFFFFFFLLPVQCILGVAFENVSVRRKISECVTS